MVVRLHRLCHYVPFYFVIVAALIADCSCTLEAPAEPVTADTVEDTSSGPVVGVVVLCLALSALCVVGGVCIGRRSRSTSPDTEASRGHLRSSADDIISSGGSSPTGSDRYETDEDSAGGTPKHGRRRLVEAEVGVRFATTKAALAPLKNIAMRKSVSVVGRDRAEKAAVTIQRFWRDSIATEDDRESLALLRTKKGLPARSKDKPRPLLRHSSESVGVQSTPKRPRTAVAHQGAGDPATQAVEEFVKLVEMCTQTRSELARLVAQCDMPLNNPAVCQNALQQQRSTLVVLLQRLSRLPLALSSFADPLEAELERQDRGDKSARKARQLQVLVTQLQQWLSPEKQQVDAAVAQLEAFVPNSGTPWADVMGRVAQLMARLKRLAADSEGEIDKLFLALKSIQESESALLGQAKVELRPTAQRLPRLASMASIKVNNTMSPSMSMQRRGASADGMEDVSAELVSFARELQYMQSQLSAKLDRLKAFSLSLEDGSDELTDLRELMVAFKQAQNDVTTKLSTLKDASRLFDPAVRQAKVRPVAASFKSHQQDLFDLFVAADMVMGEDSVGSEGVARTERLVVNIDDLLAKVSSTEEAGFGPLTFNDEFVRVLESSVQNVVRCIDRAQEKLADASAHQAEYERYERFAEQLKEVLADLYDVNKKHVGTRLPSYVGSDWAKSEARLLQQLRTITNELCDVFKAVHADDQGVGLVADTEALESDMRQLLERALEDRAFAQDDLADARRSVSSMDRAQLKATIAELNRRNPKALSDIRAKFGRENTDRKVDVSRLKSAFGFFGGGGS